MKETFTAMSGNFLQNLELTKIPSLPLLPSLLQCRTGHFISIFLDRTVLKDWNEETVVCIKWPLKERGWCNDCITCFGFEMTSMQLAKGIR